MEKPGTKAPTPVHDIFDLRRIRRLVELMKEHDLSEVDIREGTTRIRLRRGAEEPTVTLAAPRAAAAPFASGPTAQGAATAGSPKADEAHISLITSPIVGTFYLSPNPESPPFVKVGDHVGPETTVCIVEAMKVFNQIQAEVSGKIQALLVENGQPVEFGQPLFKVDTRG
jgi:acetyl-CoA carboxylase biotin carboxyl carrier protein